ncbi:MAG: thiamine-phosphate kinase [Nitrososphaerota archaeon]
MRRLRDLGERWLLDWIRGRLDECEGASLPPGDDAADMLFEGRLIMSCDMLAKSTDIPEGMSLRDAGFKAVTAATSDVAAKGGAPVAYLISLMLPGDMLLEDFQELWAGLEEAAKLYGGRIVGGDLSSGDEIIIDVACIGKADRTISRIGARPGDILAVTGEFGSQAAGLHALLAGVRGDLLAERVIKSFSRPIARVREGVELARTGAASSSIDSSDGLARSLHELCRLNDVGFIIDEPPVSRDAKEYAARYGLDLFSLVFYGGEEYELVVTIKPLLFDAAREAVERAGGRLIAIGRASEDKAIKVRWRGEWRILEDKGYQHFVTKL